MGLSPATELERALGQYILYRNIIEEKEPDRILYLGIRKDTFNDIFVEPIGNLVINKNRLKLLVFEETQEVITKWLE